MSAHFTESHEMFRESVRRFAEQELAPHADEWEREKIFPRWVFEKMGELGFLGLAEELVRCRMAGLVMSILVQTSMATPIINEIGTDEQKEIFLKPALAGEKIAAIGVSEPNAGSDVAGIRTTAKTDGDDLVINGQKTFITNGTRCDFITLAVRTDPDNRYGGISLVLFPTDVDGFEVSKKLEKIGNHSSDTAELFFEDCRIPKRYILGNEGHGFYYIMQNFQEERLIGAISGVAGSQFTLDSTIQYTREREAFGKPIHKFQVNAHKIVDMMTRLEAARRLAYHACDLYARDEYAVKEISMAKLFAGEVVKDVADQCLQLHGGWGYIEEFDVARAWRDARLLSIGGGTAEVMKEIIRKLIDV